MRPRKGDLAIQFLNNLPDKLMGGFQFGYGIAKDRAMNRRQQEQDAYERQLNQLKMAAQQAELEYKNRGLQHDQTVHAFNREKWEKQPERVRDTAAVQGLGPKAVNMPVFTAANSALVAAQVEELEKQKRNEEINQRARIAGSEAAARFPYQQKLQNMRTESAKAAQIPKVADPGKYESDAVVRARLQQGEDPKIIKGEGEYKQDLAFYNLLANEAAKEGIDIEKLSPSQARQYAASKRQLWPLWVDPQSVLRMFPDAKGQYGAPIGPSMEPAAADLYIDPEQEQEY